jgi:hypothetical protein
VSLAKNGHSCSLLIVYSKIFTNIAAIHFLTQRRRAISVDDGLFAQWLFLWF